MKKFITIFLSVLFIFSLCTISANATDRMIGDVDGDNAITSSDALLTLKSIVGLAEFDNIQEAAADTNFDGYVNSTDALLMLQYSTGIIDSFDI